MEPLVSVILPSYNRFDSLLNSIKSINEQTHKNIEIIVINDGSTDKRYDEYVFDNNVNLISLKENSVNLKGYFSDSIRNYGIAESKGKYIAFLDDDDYWFPNKIEKQIDKLENTKFKISTSEALTGYGAFNNDKEYKLYNQDVHFNEISKIYKKSRLKNHFTKKFLFKFYYPEIWDINFIKVHNCIITSSLIVESELIKKIGGFREIQTKNHYSDYDCWLGLLTHSDCYYFKEPLLYYDMTKGMNIDTK